MQFSIEITKPKWIPVIEIPKGTTLVPERSDDWYQNLTKAARAVTAKCGCYQWHMQHETLYVGSFRPYKSKAYKSSLQARVHNYLLNHSISEKGYKNTNLTVFEKLNETLPQSVVTLSYLSFETIRVGTETISFAEFSVDPKLVRAVEELLICSYRRAKQCTWNKS